MCHSNPCLADISKHVAREVAKTESFAPYPWLTIDHNVPLFTGLKYETWTALNQFQDAVRLPRGAEILYDTAKARIPVEYCFELFPGTIKFTDGERVTSENTSTFELLDVLRSDTLMDIAKNIAETFKTKLDGITFWNVAATSGPVKLDLQLTSEASSLINIARDVRVFANTSQGPPGAALDHLRDLARHEHEAALRDQRSSKVPNANHMELLNGLLDGTRGNFAEGTLLDSLKPSDWADLRTHMNSITKPALRVCFNCGIKGYPNVSHHDVVAREQVNHTDSLIKCMFPTRHRR